LNGFAKKTRTLALEIARYQFIIDVAGAEDDALFAACCQERRDERFGVAFGHDAVRDQNGSWVGQLSARGGRRG
jgi:hypothetical protein